MEEYVDCYVNNFKRCSDAEFDERVSGDRALLAAAGLEVPAVEEATEPNSESLVRSTDSLTDLTVMTDRLHALHAYTASFNVMMEAHCLPADGARKHRVHTGCHMSGQRMTRAKLKFCGPRTTKF